MLNKYQALIKGALVSEGKYSEALDLQAYSLASALVTLEMATDAISKLDSVVVDSPQGKKAHPVFKIQKDAMDSVTRQMKALGLTGEEVVQDEEYDPMVELTEQVRDSSKGKPKIIKPAPKKEDD